MKSIPRLTPILAAFLFCASAVAAENPDVVFFRKAAQSSLSEITAAEAVQRQSDNAALKGQAADMLRDHAAAMRTLSSLAAAKGIELPQIASGEDDSALTAIRPLSGVAFDKAYVEWQIGAHRDAIALFKTESTTGDDLDARQFALATLPILQRHLDHLLSAPVESPVRTQ